MIPDSIVQLFAADQIQIFSKRFMAIFKSKMAIFNNILKQILRDLIVQFFVANKIRIFMKRSLVIYKSKMASCKPKMAIIGHFGFKNGHGSFRKYFHLIGSEKLYYGVWNYQLLNTFLFLSNVNKKKPKDGHFRLKNGHFKF